MGIESLILFYRCSTGAGAPDKPSPGEKVAEHSEAIKIAMLAGGKHTIKNSEAGRGTAKSEVRKMPIQMRKRKISARIPLQPQWCSAQRIKISMVAGGNHTIIQCAHWGHLLPGRRVCGFTA